MALAASLLRDLLTCLRFATTLPLPALAFERDAPLDFSRFARALALFPLAGALVGALGATALALALALGLPPALAAPLGVAAMIIVTGALHEDGLADCADGFGGATRARRLEIMADSRLGAFGALAIALSLYMRVAALAVLGAGGAFAAGATMVAAGALSRAAALAPLALLAPARAAGAGFSAGRPPPRAVVLACVLACAITALAAGGSFLRAFLACVLAAAAALGVAALARRRLGGQTGDVAGAAQQIAEILVLLTFAARM
ncbi:adenosylcobinamide-GDP ribazoletransferase [Methylocella sp.]|uniref:adenosylcobinamide-GDP ribazoletransferase n=1 Tax=Methylocella sp. TaxID=1978226 RepID=UPI0035B0B6F8